ncbi:uncharacterized protein JCM6883_000386 [Sporobolomyces salmoneus]|uniref:uncharacterized protein n=1 Tax=Sporobolomyces salmoneus TaxID=183962 RepID=UPI00317A036F
MEGDTHTLSTEQLSLGLNARGLTFHSLVVNSSSSSGGSRDVLVGFEDQESYRERLFFGSTVGRYANRLPAGKTVLSTGSEISLNGPNSVCLHGGDSGFDTLPWTPLPRSDSSLFPLSDPFHCPPPLPSDPHAPKQAAEQVFRLYSPAGNDGFPCTLINEALVSVEAPEEGKKKGELGKVKVVLRSKIVEDGDKDIEKGTPVNLTVHWGFRLDDCQGQDILNHSLYIDSTELVSLDDKGLSTGSIDQIPQNGKEFDFSKSRKIGDSYPQGGIDRNYLLTPHASSTPIASSPQLILTAPETSSGPRLELSFKTSLPSVQIYSAPGLDGSGPSKKSAHQPKSTQSSGDEKGEGYGKDGALFIEFQQPVGTVSHTCAQDAKEGNELKEWLGERFEKMGMEEGERGWEKDTLVRKGQVWESWVEVEVREL